MEWTAEESEGSGSGSKNFAIVVPEPRKKQGSSDSIRQCQPKRSNHHDHRRERSGQRHTQPGEPDSSDDYLSTLRSHSRSDSCSRRRSNQKDLVRTFSKKARKLPQPHAVAYPKAGTKKKVTALDLSGDEFFSNSPRVAVCLAKQLSGDYSDTMLEYMEYLEYSASVRCGFADEAVLTFDDEFRGAIKNEGPSLSDPQKKAAVSGKCFRANTVKTPENQKVKASIQLSRGSRQKFRYKFPCCFFRQKNQCLKMNGRCSCDHVCGHYRSKQHQGQACTNKPAHAAP